MSFRIRAVCLFMGAALAAQAGDRAPRVGADAREAIAKEMRSWSPDAGHPGTGSRPKPFVREKGILPLPRGIWVQEQSGFGRRAGSKPEPKMANRKDAYRLFRDDLFSLETARSDDGALRDYQAVLLEAAQAARSNQHINYVPIIVSSLQYGILDGRNQPSGKKETYFRALPHKSLQYSQLITFGLEPGFVLNNLGKELVSLELSIDGKTYPLDMEGSVPVAFANPGVYPVSVQARFRDGSFLASDFQFEIKRLDDGTYANSQVDSDGTIKFKM